jgi:class 3 adenylate cyclase
VADLPTGTVTFLFTDVEGSTRLLQKLGDDRKSSGRGRREGSLRAASIRTRRSDA